MATNRERKEDSLEEELTRWHAFKKAVMHTPLIFFPIPIIFVIVISRIFIDDPLAGSLLSMVSTIACGVQWFGIARNRRKMSIDHKIFDEKQLKQMFKLNEMSASLGADAFTRITFLSPYKPNYLRAFWYKLTKKRMLSLYNMGQGMSTSFTKYIVSEKDWFYLQLRNCIDTQCPEILAEGRKYLKDHKQVATIF